MKNNSFQIRAFAVASVMGMLCVASVTEARAAETAGSVYRESTKPAVSVESLETYTLVKLNRVYFNYEASDLSAEEKLALNDVARRFSASTQSVIELRGYADGMESAQGAGLGAKRSQTIAHYLSAKGIPPDSILLVAGDGMSDDGRSMNREHRRVDIRVFTAAKSGEGDTASKP